MYSVADRGSTQPAKITLKNSQPNAAIVNGLISQLTTSVSIRPLGFLPTSLRAEKSICTIIG